MARALQKGFLTLAWSPVQQIFMLVPHCLDQHGDWPLGDGQQITKLCQQS